MSTTKTAPKRGKPKPRLAEVIPFPIGATAAATQARSRRKPEGRFLTELRKDDGFIHGKVFDRRGNAIASAIWVDAPVAIHALYEFFATAAAQVAAAIDAERVAGK